MTIDHEATLDASGRGFSPGQGPSPGIHHANGGSGASHGGRGGMGAYVSSAEKAYGNVLGPEEFGSGGSDGGYSGVSKIIFHLFSSSWNTVKELGFIFCEKNHSHDIRVFTVLECLTN